MRIDGEFNIYTVAELKQPLLESLANQATPILDLSQVSEMDSAGLQLLLLLKREADSLGRPLRLSGNNPVVNEVLELCNLSYLFETAA